MRIVLIGIQGSGKSTQGSVISGRLKIPFISAGDIIRELMQGTGPVSAYIKDIVNSGRLIPDEKTIEIFATYLKKEEFRNGYIIDGFPRTINQADEFPDPIDWVIYIETPDDVALDRIKKRQDSRRADETDAAIKRRIEAFHAHTKPLIEYYKEKGNLITVDGTQSVDAVSDSILIGMGELADNSI